MAAWIGSLIVADQPAPWLPGDARLVALGGETGLAVDDIGALTDRDGVLVIQAKGRLQLTKRRTSAFAAAVDQVVRQFVDGVPAGESPRAVDEQRDRLVIVGDGLSSQAIKELSTVAERLRTLPSIMPLSSAATNAEQQRALETLLDHVGESWASATAQSPSDHEIRKLFRVFAVDVLALEDGGADRATVDVHLRGALLDPVNDVKAWAGLIALGQKVSEKRTWLRRSDIAAALDAIGAPIGPGRRHAGNVRTLRRVSEANRGFLAEHAGLPLGDGIVSCDRSALGDLMDLQGNVVIVGDPGCGKSGLVYELASHLTTVEDVLVLTVDGLPDSAGTARLEFGLDADLVETLQEWTGAGRASLILDGLDAARGEGTRWLARACESLAGTRWRVIATMRRFDLGHNLAWQRVFRANDGTPLPGNPAPELLGVRNYLLGNLSDADLAQLATASPGVGGLLDGVSPRMLDLVRNPFNLRLAIELMETGTSVASLAETRDQLHLLHRYWRLRVADAPGGSSRVRALSAITAEMLSSRRLRVDPSIVPDAVLVAVDDLLHDGVLHEAASRLVASGPAVLVYSHHILFDFATAALVLTAAGESRLVALLDEDPNLAVIARPSIDLHLADLWHAETDRSAFSTVVCELVTSEHPVAGVAAARVAAEYVRDPGDIRWLVDLLPEHPESAITFIGWLCGVLDAAEPQLVAGIRDALAVWADLTSHLTDALERQFTPAAAQTLFRLLFQIDKIDALTATSGGSDARASSAARMFAICLSDPTDRAWLAARAAQLLPRAIALHGEHSAALLRVISDDSVVSAFGPEVMRLFVDGIELIADGDADAATAVLVAVWRWQEVRDEPTYITQGVLPLRSTRKQDVDLVKWLSGERFPAFVEKAGLLRSLVVVASALGDDQERYEGYARDEIHAFGAVGELLPMAHDLDHGAGSGAAAKIVDGFVTALGTQTLQEPEVVEVVKAMVSSVSHPEFWAKVLRRARELPDWQIPVARVLASGALIVASDTRAAAGKLLGALTGVIDAGQHAELLEVPIQHAAALFPPGSSEWRDRAVDQMLGCLDVAKVQDPDLRSRLTALLAAGAPPTIPEPSHIGGSWGEPLALADVIGATVHDTLTDTAKQALDALWGALADAQGDALEGTAFSSLVGALESVMAEGGLDAEPVMELTTRAAERLARELTVLPGTQVGELIVHILVNAAKSDPQT